LLLVNVLLCIYLVKAPFHFLKEGTGKGPYAGLALATSISFLLFAVIRVMVLKVKLGREQIPIKYREFLVSFFQNNPGYFY